MREAVTAVVRSTLPEALAEAVTVARTLQGDEVQEPVTGEARTSDAKYDRVQKETTSDEW